MTSTIRTTRGLDLPAPGRWVIDPGHADVAFVGRHFGLTRIRGRFTGVDGTVVIGDDPADSTVDVRIDMASVDSGDTTRDEHLRSSDLFDVATYPQASFTSTRIDVDGRSATMHGELTIKGITREVAVDVSYLGHARDPWDNERMVFSASTTIDREDWNVTWNMVLEAGGLLVSKDIRLEVEVELLRETPGT